VARLFAVRGFAPLSFPGSPEAARAAELGATDEGSEMRTYSPKASEIQRAWHVIDAEGLILGRLCTETARILRGKHKPTFAPHIDTGDHVIIVNADKMVLTSDKASKKMIYRHSGYPGGISNRSYGDLMEKKPQEAVRRSIRGMLPKTRLGRAQISKLKVYSGPTHPHAAQQPQPLALEQARARS
jgi:large subunit ribosomal protein L13